MPRKIIGWIALLGLLTSCLSLKKGEQYRFYGYLPQKGATIGYLDVEASLSLVKGLLEILDFPPALQRTVRDRVKYLFFEVDSLNVPKGQSPLYAIVGVTTLDTRLLNTVFLTQPGWEITDLHSLSWRNREEGLLVASPEPHVVYITNDLSHTESQPAYHDTGVLFSLFPSVREAAADLADPPLAMLENTGDLWIQFGNFPKIETSFGVPLSIPIQSIIMQGHFLEADSPSVERDRLKLTVDIEFADLIPKGVKGLLLSAFTKLIRRSVPDNASLLQNLHYNQADNRLQILGAEVEVGSFSRSLVSLIRQGTPQ